MSHTPGPWTYTTPKFGEDHTLITDMCTPLGKVFIQDTSKRAHDQALANAKLIAAAPALLAALELTLATMDRLEAKYGPFLSVQGTRDVANQAIAQAKGN